MRRAELELMTKKELLEIARELEIPRRSLLSKDGLIRVLVKHRTVGRGPVFESRSKSSPSARKSTGRKAVGKKKGTRKPTAKAVAPVQSKHSRRPVTSRKSAAPSGPDEKARGKGPRRAPLGAPLTMPEQYGRDYVALMARDPYWLHAYWEIRPESLDRLRGMLGEEWTDHRMVLRVFSFPPETDLDGVDSEQGHDRYDVDLAPEMRNWYLNVGRPDRVYQVSVGILTRAGAFHSLARSNGVRLPRDTHSSVTDEEWTSPAEAFRHFYENPGGTTKDAKSSVELTPLLRERLGADWSSGMLGSMASGALERPEMPRQGFWFVLDTELIVYGATEPDASVTVQGRPLQLRPDGTFSLRFQLPDGTQVMDATAISADGAFRRTITPTVRRETSSTETIEAQVGS